MRLQITALIGDTRYAVDLSSPRDISIPVRFDGPQPSVFGVPPARRVPYVTTGFVGDVRQGGSCNCDIFHFAAHTSGTHTEGVGHLSSESIPIHEVLRDSLIAATLVTVAPVAANNARETYEPTLRPYDRLITRAVVEDALRQCDPDFLDAVVLRTTPNGPEKITQNHDEQRPPFFTIEAMNYLVQRGVTHLLVDMPSIDRLDDEGKLTNHHVFWEVPLGQRPGEMRSQRTVTELIYVPNEIADGQYLLNLQIAPFIADAAPSRPLLYELTRQ